jgi:hypothetical protein
MRDNILYFIALLFIVGWLLGFFVFDGGATIHLLLVVAIILIIMRITQERKVL